MPKLALALAALLPVSTLAVAQPVQAPSTYGETPGHTCRATKTARFIGKTGTKMMGEAIKDVTGAAVLRWAPPYTMLSMEYRADRVNVYVDAHRKITKINCG